MKEIKPLKEMTVKYNGQEVKVFRQEILEDDTLAMLLLSYERAASEVAEAEYRLRHAAHAKRSMEFEFKEKLLKHVVDTRFTKQEEGSDDADPAG